MPGSALALVVLAGLIHASWNIAAKKAHGDARFAFFTVVVLLVFWAPLGLWLGYQQLPQWGVAQWALVAVSGVLHVVYYVVLLRGYRKADLTVVYPLARGSGPLLSSLVAVGLLGEQVSALGGLGILCAPQLLDDNSLVPRVYLNGLFPNEEKLLMVSRMLFTQV